MKLLFLKNNAARARGILQTNGIQVIRLQEAFGGEFELTVGSGKFERAQELLAAAGIEVTHTR
jgi:hypothetical protein